MRIARTEVQHLATPTRCIAVARVAREGRKVTADDRHVLVFHPVLPPVYRGVVREARA